MKVCFATLAAGLSLVLVGSSHAANGEPTGSARISFTKIADTSTNVPGHNAPFTGFAYAAADAGLVAFTGFSQPVGEGLYLKTGAGLVTVVDTLTEAPTLPPGNLFTGFSPPSLDGGLVAFFAIVPGITADYESIFVGNGGPLTLVVDVGDPVPGHPGYIFNFLFFPSLSRGNVGFGGVGVGPGDDLKGVFSTVGGLHAVADTTTPIPGGTGLFVDICFNPSLSGNHLAYCGGDGTSGPDGIYTDGLNYTPLVAPFVVADKSTPIPGGTGTFTAFYETPIVRGGEIAFRAGGTGGQIGVYSNLGGLHVVADTATSIPGGSGTFTGFRESFPFVGPSLNGARAVSFNGEGTAGQRGVYAQRGSLLVKVLAAGDSLDGKVVSFVEQSRESFDGNQLAMVVGFTDGSAGVYVASLP